MNLLSPPERGWRALRFLIQGILFLIVLAWIVKTVSRNWQAIGQNQFVAPHWIVPSALLGLLGLLGFAWITRLFSCLHGVALTFPVAVAVSYVPMLGKYLPGRVWTVGAALGLYHRFGVPADSALHVLICCHLLSFASALLLSVALGVNEVIPMGASSQVAFAAVVVLCVWMLPPLLRAVVQVCSRRFYAKRHEFPATPPQQLLLLFAVNVGVWIIYGMGFFCLARTIDAVPFAFAGRCIALFVASQIAGFLAVFAPAGFGVREGVLVLGLTPFMGESDSIVLAALCRVWQTSLELVMAAAGGVTLRQFARGGPVVGSRQTER